ncbi:DUF2513 domain-containing protein [Pantoea sp. OVA07A]|uniref:DUF2513 domain-containing protein n=1 Tax=Pantoea sp. OVA07A TaxID=2862677 RepID=UPI001CBB7839|nr:DUF2513 domain-containing protein [Pantoea sp. OVA07A]
MKIDQQYLKDLLIAFEDTEGSDTSENDLLKAGIDTKSPEFKFHMRLLGDKEFISRLNGEPGWEFYRPVNVGSFTMHVESSLRLTAKGHDFISDLRQKEVWNTVKNNFSDASLSTLSDVVKELAKGYAKQKIKRLTGFNPE